LEAEPVLDPIAYKPESVDATAKSLAKYGTGDLEAQVSVIGSYSSFSDRDRPP